ncbi:MAG TPA: class I SAM-dependent methyltransferase [Candidatus Cybelea sp.]|nr:class I SAM-dependent methyltransferase [Candidatus Cybelea sp.]
MSTAISIQTAFGDVVDVIRAAVDLGARKRSGRRSTAENRLIKRAERRPPLDEATRVALTAAIKAGEDPLGEALQSLHDREKRRKTGMFYTPALIVQPMVGWVLRGQPDLVVDPGCGSGRFAAEVARRSPQTSLLAIDKDPAATLITRAVLAVLGARSYKVRHADFLKVKARSIRPNARTRVGWVGNPPFVRHHAFARSVKQHRLKIAVAAGHESLMTAGLHLMFFAKTKTLARKGDVGCYVTSAEWMDNRSGRFVRELFLNGLGGTHIAVIDPETFIFAGVKTTAAITRFVLGEHAGPKRFTLGVATDALAAHLLDDDAGHVVGTGRLLHARGWTHAVTNPDAMEYHGPTIGDLFRVSRGTATGSNAFFALTPERAEELGVQKYGVPTVTRAEEIIASAGELRRRSGLKVVLDIPKALERRGDPALDAYLKTGEKPGPDGTTVSAGSNAQKRTPWWVLNVSKPAIVATYMARRPPAFATNPDRLGILNIALGLVPKIPLTDAQLREVVDALNAAAPTFESHAVTYFGNLKKFEPKAVAALPLPRSLHGLLQQNHR